jgi:hypothetical protein
LFIRSLVTNVVELDPLTVWDGLKNSQFMCAWKHVDNSCINCNCMHCNEAV